MNPAEEAVIPELWLPKGQIERQLLDRGNCEVSISCYVMARDFNVANNKFNGSLWKREVTCQAPAVQGAIAQFEGMEVGTGRRETGEELINNAPG